MAGAGERPTLLISDITGVTGMSILRAIVAGERDCLKLAQMKHPPNQEQHPEIAKASEGDYTKEHLFALQTALELTTAISSKSWSVTGAPKRPLRFLKPK
jgi:hypothetical protein